MSKEEIKKGAKYKDLKQKGYSKIGDMYFVLMNDFWKFTQRCRLSKKDVESMMKSQNIMIIEEI